MKNLLIVSLLLLVSLSVAAQKTSVSGTIKGFKNDTLTIYFLPLKQGETPIIDRVICVDGKLNYEVQLASPLPHLVRISSKKWNAFEVDTHPYLVENSDINFFLEPGNRIDFTAEPRPAGIYCQAFGNQINEQRNEFTKLLFPYHADFNQHCLKFAAAKMDKDSLLLKNETERIEQLKKLIQQKTISFIQKHPDWEISAEVLMGLPTDSCLKYFHHLGPNAKSSFFGQYAQNVLFAAKVGDLAPTFSLPDSNGEMVSLSGFKGKFVVLEFWGTWCGYCLKDIPTMKIFYARYKTKIEFIGIACRDAEPHWKEALKKYKINWVSLLSPDEKLPTMYGVEGYPTKIIINPEGIIIGKYLGEGRDFYCELDRMFKN